MGGSLHAYKDDGEGSLTATVEGSAVPSRTAAMRCGGWMDDRVLLDRPKSICVPSLGSGHLLTSGDATHFSCTTSLTLTTQARLEWFRLLNWLEKRKNPRRK
eukprot:TRINITY_DN1250_c0_g1_i4.p3 TRINITY_DN1250_c0_g1~~TRINITY_DN1250_c0_g1_i4.p3  ORF type:complete len:102 (-),score=6.43 TRINITY_DN1250_c0_g1_i4:408-713(-)